MHILASAALACICAAAAYDGREQVAARGVPPGRGVLASPSQQAASRPAEPPPAQPAGANADDTRRSVRTAVERGLRFISRRQTESDGSVSLARDTFSGLPLADDHRAPFAVTALAALAYMADGNTESHGPYSAHLHAAIDYILSKATFESGRDGVEEAYLASDGDHRSRMHGHGYATLALAEVYGMSGAIGGPKAGRARLDRIHRALTAAVRRIESSQGALGGWYYTPRPDDSHEGSVTITLVQALRAARNAGIAVSATTIHRAIEYVRRSQVDSGPTVGAFRYQIGSQDISVGLTAAAISTLNATGDYDSEVIDRGMKFMMTQLGDPTLVRNMNNEIRCPSYDIFYIAQALRQYRDPEAFPEWMRQQRAKLLKAQQVRAVDAQSDEGWWSDPYGETLATAFRVMILRMEDSYLPIFER